jgi:hypothetical protein
MSVTAARRLFIAFFAIYAIVLTYPGVLPFNRIRPFVLGLPFPFAWVVLWVVLAFGVFIVVDRAESASGEGED